MQFKSIKFIKLILNHKQFHYHFCLNKFDDQNPKNKTVYN